MLKLIAASVIRLQPEPSRLSPEDHRRNPEKPISFFNYDGQNLYVVEGKSSDAHSELLKNAPFSEFVATGRVDRAVNRGTFNLDPDFMTGDRFEQIMAALNEEYPGCSWMAEYYGQWYRSMPDLRDELGRI